MNVTSGIRVTKAYRSHRFEQAALANELENQRPLSNSGSLVQKCNILLKHPNRITKGIEYESIFVLEKSRERFWNENLSIVIARPTTSNIPIIMRHQVENYAVKPGDKHGETGPKQRYSEKYGITCTNYSLIKDLPAVDGVHLRAKVPISWGDDVKGTGQHDNIVPDTKGNLLQSEVALIRESSFSKMQLFRTKQTTNTTDASRKAFDICYSTSIKNKWGRLSVNSPKALKEVSGVLASDRFKQSEEEDENIINCDCRILSTTQCVPKDSPDRTRTLTIAGNGTAGIATSKKGNGCATLCRHLGGFFDAASGSLSEVRNSSATLDCSKLEVNKTRWFKVKQAIISRRHKEKSDLQNMSQHQPSEHVDTRQCQHTTTHRMSFRRPSRMDSKPELKQVDLEGEDEHRAAVPSLMEDPLMIKISKKNRNIGKFTCKPESIPEAVCFEISGARLRHQDVKTKVEAILQADPEVKIVAIQFHHRTLINNQKEMNNRWIITTNSVTGRNSLAGKNLNFDGDVVRLLSYDEVINAEYQQFLRMKNFVAMMDNRKILT